MANPTEPQAYPKDPAYTVYRVNDLTNALALYGPASTSYWIPQYISGGWDLWNILGGDFVDRVGPTPIGPGWLSGSGQAYVVNLLLFNPAGWGRDLDITLDIDPSLGA